jgi:aldehyde dehydrogenase (NAD+)
VLDKRNFYINGKWVKPSQINDYVVINPSNEEVFATISLGSEKDLNTAVVKLKFSVGGQFEEQEITFNIEA